MSLEIKDRVLASFPSYCEWGEFEYDIGLLGFDRRDSHDVEDDVVRKLKVKAPNLVGY